MHSSTSSLVNGSLLAEISSFLLTWLTSTGKETSAMGRKHVLRLLSDQILTSCFMLCRLTYNNSGIDLIHDGHHVAGFLLRAGNRLFLPAVQVNVTSYFTEIFTEIIQRTYVCSKVKLHCVYGKILLSPSNQSCEDMWHMLSL